MNYQILFSGKNISKCRMLKFQLITPSVNEAVIIVIWCSHFELYLTIQKMSTNFSLLDACMFLYLSSLATW